MASDDSALWRSWLDRRDQAAFAALVTQHIGFATGFARRLGCSAADAEDVTQRALVRLAGEAREKPGRVGIRAWLGRDVLQESRKSARSRDRRIQHEAMAPPRAAESFEAIDVRDAVEAALVTLDEEDRLAVELRFLHDLEYRDVAFVLGCSGLACRLRVHRAVKKMRRKLGRGASLIVATWAPISGTPADASARIANAIAAARPAVMTPPTAIVLGGILVGKKLISLAAGLLLLLGGAFYLTVARGGGGDGSVPDRPAAALDLARRQPTLAARAAEAAKAPASATAAVPAAADLTKGSLEVRALARDGTAIPDEPFSVYLNGGPGALGHRFSRTGADGRGRLDGLEPGEVFVYSGHGPGRVDVVVTAGGVAHADIQLPRGVDIEGVVVDALGSPVVGAQVRIENGSSYGMLELALTKVDGRFALQDVKPGSSVCARADGYAPSACTALQLGAGKTETVRLVLGGQGASVRGRVEDAARSPVAGALVEIGAPLRQLSGRPDVAQPVAGPLHVVTADDGTFVADGLPVGEAWITVRARGHGPYRALRNLAIGPAPNDLTIALPAGVAIEGVVVDGAGSPVEGADVWGSYLWGPLGSWKSRTDAEGRFRLDDLPSEQPANLRAFHALKGHAVVYSGEKAGPLDAIVRLVLQPWILIRVRVVDELGNPIAKRPVRARWLMHPANDSGQSTDADGRATLYVDVQGTYEVYVTDPEGDDAQPSSRLRGVRPGADEVTLTVRGKDRPTAKLVGRLTVPEGHIPEGALVSAISYVGFATVNLALDAASGRFESKVLQPGRYDVRLTAAGLGTVPLGRVRVDARQTLDLGDIRLDPPGSLVVKLHGTEGRARGWQVGAEGARGSVWAPPNPDGSARFAFLPPGRYRIIVPAWPLGAVPTAGASASVSIEAGREASLELTAAPGHVRRIRVEGLATDEVPGLTIEVHAEGENAVLVQTRWMDAARESDPGVMGAFAPGRYVAEAETADGRRASAAFEVLGDGEPPVVLTGFR